MANPQEIEAILKDENKLHDIAKAAFDAVDADGSGAIDSSELKIVMESVANDIGMDKPSDAEVRDVFMELDQDGNGEIDLEEFKVLIKQVLQIMASQG